MQKEMKWQIRFIGYYFNYAKYRRKLYKQEE